MLKKFGNSACLRIRYAFYLLEYIENKDAAMRQFKKAENYNPAFDESFVIYRYLKILQEGMNDAPNKQAAVGMDVVSTIAYENYYRQFKKGLERAAKLHIEFWRELNTNAPDVEQLMELGTKISKTISEIEDSWCQMQRLNPNAVKSVKMYASFLKEVLGDNDTAIELLKSISGNRGVKNQYNDNENNENLKNEYHFMTPYLRDGTPSLCVSGESRSLGLIKYANKSLYRILCYSEGYLAKKNLNILIPDIIAAHHDQFMSKVIESPDNASHLSQEMLLPCKMGNGYITAMQICIRELPSFINDMHFVATFKPDRGARGREVSYLILDPDGFITDISERILLI